MPDEETAEPIYRPNPVDMAGFAAHAPYIARALDALPTQQAEALRGAMVDRRITYEQREGGVVVVVDGFELCVVPDDAADPDIATSGR